MAVDPNTLTVGKCYVTASGQVRRILEIDGSDVVYEARGKKNVPAPWGSKTTVDTQRFADAVEREVPCHYDPDFES
jgi:hypothetical protein